MKRHPYFTRLPEDPPHLSVTVERTCRFEEVDALNIAWHGRYPSYLEDARVAFGERYGVGYMDFHAQGIAIPIKQMHLDYHAPLRFGDTCRICAELHWSDAARINFAYRILSPTGLVLTTAYTVQLFVLPDGTLYTARPDFYEDFCVRWRNGEFD